MLFNSQVKHGENSGEKDAFISYDDFMEGIGHGASNNVETITNVVDKLLTTKIEWNVLGKDNTVTPEVKRLFAWRLVERFPAIERLHGGEDEPWPKAA